MSKVHEGLPVCLSAGVGFSEDTYTLLLPQVRPEYSSSFTHTELQDTCWSSDKAKSNFPAYFFSRKHICLFLERANVEGNFFAKPPLTDVTVTCPVTSLLSLALLEIKWKVFKHFHTMFYVQSELYHLILQVQRLNRFAQPPMWGPIWYLAVFATITSLHSDVNLSGFLFSNGVQTLSFSTKILESPSAAFADSLFESDWTWATPTISVSMVKYLLDCETARCTIQATRVLWLPSTGACGLATIPTSCSWLRSVWFSAIAVWQLFYLFPVILSPCTIPCHLSLVFLF